MSYTVAKDGVKLHYSIHDYTDPWKKVPTLILQHGLSRSSNFWYSMIPYLSRFYKVVCPDLRAVGGSPRDFDLAKGITLDNYLSDIIAVADSVKADTFHFVGESLGGIIGFYLGAQHAARVRTLSVLSSPLGITPWMKDAFSFGHENWETAVRSMGVRAWSDAMNANTRFPADSDKAMLDWYSGEVARSNEVEVLIAMSHNAQKVDPAAILDKVRVPVLGLYPATSKIVTEDQLRQLTEKIPNSRIVRLPTHYHMTWVLAPATCAEYILHFVSTNDGIVCRDA